MRVTVLVNRRAARLARSGPVLDALRRAPAGVETIETGSLAELRDAAVRLAAAPPECVVLAGGDGTYMEGVSALARALGDEGLSALPIFLAPCGTANTVARAWGFRGGGLASFGDGGAARYVTRALAELAERAPGSVRATVRPTLRAADEETTRVGFIVGAGLVARFFEAYERAGAGGERTAARIVARIFAGSFVGGRLAREVLTPAPCALEIDGAGAPFDRVSLVCASVVGDLGLGMRLLYRAGEELERFHVVATPAPPRALGPQMPRVLRGLPLSDPKVDALAEHLSLRFPPGTGAYVLDGELLRRDEVRVTRGPALRVVDLA